VNNYYLCFFKNKNPLYIFARIIEWVDHTDYSHVEIVKVIDDNWDDAVSCGSVFPKSRRIKLNELKKHYELKKAIPLITKVENPESVLDVLMDKPYSFVQIIITGFKILTKGAFAKLSYVKVNLSQMLICTELAGIFMQEACSLRFSISPETMSLDDCEAIALGALREDI
jgi:hypothetical protein